MYIDGIDTICNDVNVEVRKATAQHGAMTSVHEAYGVIAEEFDEFFDYVKANPAKMTPAQQLEHYKGMRKELIQTAAMCVRAIFDLGITLSGTTIDTAKEGKECGC